MKMTTTLPQPSLRNPPSSSKKSSGDEPVYFTVCMIFLWQRSCCRARLSLPGIAFLAS
jgi:hypothetical protein